MMISFIIGLMVGNALGIFFAALLAAASNDDERNGRDVALILVQNVQRCITHSSLIHQLDMCRWYRI